jgi:serine/threonine protein kinase/WD40 repeat protein
MTPAKLSQPTIEQLAEDFLQRFRRGERPGIAEYTARYPELAADIRDVFAALVLVEEAGPQEASRPAAFRGRVTADGKVPQQLGDYRIIREVGRGGMGVVYEAVQEALGRHVALKVLPYEASANPIYLERFTREARAAARLHHTNIVPVYDVGEHQGVHYYAMQFIQGQGLDEVLLELRRLRSSKVTRGLSSNGAAASVVQGLLSGNFSSGEPVEAGPPDGPAQQAGASSILKTQSALSTGADHQYYRSVVRLGLQVAEALGYAHAQKVLHRDIKPSNLLLDLRGTVWVTDFGLAKEGGDDLTKTGDVVGTLRYLAPERFNGVSEARSDIYSVGLTLYEMLTLQPAFDEQDRGRLIRWITHHEPPAPRRIDRRIPRDLETIVLKAIAKEPEKRYQTAEELAEDLRRFLADRPIWARRTSWREHAWRWVRRNPGWAATLAAVFGLLLVMAVGGMILNLHLQKALTNAREAEQGKTEKLWQSLLERAAAKRTSGRVGQRFESLQAIREAAQIRITPELRDEAAAALVLPDVEPAADWEGTTDEALHVAFDASYRRYITLDRNGALTLYRRTSDGSKVVASLPPQGVPPFHLLWMSPDGRFAAYGYLSGGHGASGRLRVVRLGETSIEETRNDAPGICDKALAFRADCKQLAVGHSDGSVSIYDAETGKPLRRFQLGVAPQILTFHPREGRLAVACGNSVRLFDVDTGRELPVLRHSQEITRTYGLAWHPDGRRLAAGCNDHRIHIWDAESATEVMRPLTGHEDGIVMTFNHAGDRLASSDWSGQIRLWDTESGSLLLTTSGFVTQFSADDDLVGYRLENKRLTLWRLASGRELRTLRHRQAVDGERIYAPVLDADGRMVAASTQCPPFRGKNGVGFFDIETGEQMAFVPLGQAEMCRAYFPADGWLTAGGNGLLSWPMRSNSAQLREVMIGPPRQLASNFPQFGVGASEDGRIIALPHWHGAVLLDRNRPSERQLVQGQEDVRNCAVSPDGRWVVTCSHWSIDCNARIWDARTGHPVHDLPLQESTIAGFSPDNRWLATSTNGSGLRLWEVGSWREHLRVGEGMFAFDPQSRLLAVADILGVIRLLAPDTGREVARLTGPEAIWYQPVCFTPDGTRLIVSCSGGKAIVVWDLRLLRAGLKELGLDWDWPEFPDVQRESKGAKAREDVQPSPRRLPIAPSPPLRVTVDAGLLTQPLISDDRQAVAIYTLALALCPLSADAYLQRGFAYSRLRNYEGALKDLEHLQVLNPDLISCKGLFAYLGNTVAWHYVTAAAAEGRGPRVLPLAQKAVALEPGNVMHVNTLGVVFYCLGRYQDAIHCLEENAKSDADFFAFDGYFLAMAYHRLGNSSAARDWFERSDAWFKQHTDLPAVWSKELATFRSEAAALLGMKDSLSASGR